jgi:hypothetical protein
VETLIPVSECSGGEPASARTKPDGRTFFAPKYRSRCPRRASISKPMTFRFLLCAVLAFALAGCEAPYKKKDAEDRKPLKDQSHDQSFQAFLGRLKIAVGKHDLQMLASMMSSDFGYRWDTPPPGEGVFDYWDHNNLWPELAGLLRQRFVANELYMVSPPEVVTQPGFAGYRVGMRIVGGSWKFAYFVPGEPAQPAQ